MLCETGRAFRLLQGVNWQPPKLLIGWSICLITLLLGCTTTALLNSERIRERFGSYGIEILEASEKRRVSNLFSLSNGGRVCRTLAVVWFTEPRPAAVETLHKKITAGGSIGEVFKSAGWRVRKENLYVGQIEIGSKGGQLAQLMRVEALNDLALHIYEFRIGRDADDLVYATIAELHHPDYLDPGRLGTIYGEGAATAPPWVATQIRKLLPQLVQEPGSQNGSDSNWSKPPNGYVPQTG